MTAKATAIAQQRLRLCGFFTETHVSYDVSDIEWPELSPATHRFLAELPIWDEAVNTEHETAVLVRAMADHETDPVIAAAIGLQAFEEERHSALVTDLTQHYGIAITRRPTTAVTDPERAFLRSGWGETVDSFVAFGVFGIARDLELVPAKLLAVFDLVMQEEARHILFFENWRRLRRREQGVGPGGRFTAREILAAVNVVVTRLSLAAGASARPSAADENFLIAGINALDSITPRAFLTTCLHENARRFAPYDQRLARPRIVPAMARQLRPLLPDGPFGRPAPDIRPARLS